MPIPSATDAVAEPTPFVGGVSPSAGTGVRATLTEFESRRAGVLPDLRKLAPSILEGLADALERDRSDATIVNAEFASDQRLFNLEIDDLPKLYGFKELDYPLIEGTEP